MKPKCSVLPSTSRNQDCFNKERNTNPLPSTRSNRLYDELVELGWPTHIFPVYTLLQER